MHKEIQPVDITNLPELLNLAEEVRTTNTPRLLKRGDQELAVLTPVAPKVSTRYRARRRPAPIPSTDSLLNIIGMVRTEGPTDVSEQKHKYLAEAYYAEFHPPKEP